MEIHNQDDSFFILDTQELMAAKRKRGEENKLAFAVMLKFFQLDGRFLTKDYLIPDLWYSVLLLS